MFALILQSASPHIEITAEGVAALAAIIGLCTAGMAVYVKTSIKSSLAAFEVSLITKLNGTYTRKGECQAWMQEKARAGELASAKAALEATAKETERRLERLEESHAHHNYD
jgi:hypothetical protein